MLSQISIQIPAFHVSECHRFLQKEEDPEGIKLVKLNINFDGETAQKYNVTSVPTLVFFKDGAEKARLTGAVKKAQLAETINSID